MESYCIVYNISNKFEGRTILSIYDMGGNRVKDEKVTLNEGFSDFQVNIGEAIPGIYIIKIKGINFESEPVKIIKY